MPITGQPTLHGEVHHLADFLSHHLGQGAAEHSEVLGVGENLPSVNVAVTSNHGVAQEGAALSSPKSVVRWVTKRSIS